MANGEFENVQYVSPKRPRRKFHKKWLLLLLIPVLLAAAYLGAGELGYYYYIQRYGATDPKDAEIFCDPIVTAPGQLEIYAYDQTVWSFEEFADCTKLTPGQSLPEEYGHRVSNAFRALPLTFSLNDKALADTAVVFRFSVDEGEFTRRLSDGGYPTTGRAYLGQQFTLENNQTIDWHYSVNFPDLQESYSDITVYADGHIVGCATLLIYAVEVPAVPGPVVTLYYPKVLGAVSFPKQDGRYQLVTEEDVQGYFAQWKQN